MMSQQKSVVDINGARYQLTGLLGRGGQGAVYAVQGGRFAVKVISGQDPAKRERLRNQLAHVRRLPLRNLNLARPLEMLREPYIGYVMELLTDMVPIQNLLSPPKNTESILDWFQKTGSLRRRLKILGKVASILARLHGKGLAYSDPSPANIFISKDPSYDEVWFIDADNLCYESNVQSKSIVFTPRYGAPELVRGNAGVSTLTDVHAFAVIAFQALTLVHPFIGDYVNDGDPELEEQALAGHIPWVEDKANDINYASFGIPREWVLSKMLSGMFSRVFGAGRCEPSVRPGMAEWVERLLSATDATLQCTECSGTFYMDRETCTWCDAKRPIFLMAKMFLWDPGLGKNGNFVYQAKGDKRVAVPIDYLVVSEGDCAVISRRFAFGEHGDGTDNKLISIVFSDNKIHLTSLDGSEYRLSPFSGKGETKVGDITKTLIGKPGKLAWLLHFGPTEQFHRAMHFEIHPGVV